jgi:hypothetical protein
MLQPTKDKEFIGIIKSGLVGAFTFTGISFILSIASGFMYRWMAWFVYIFFLSIPFPKTVFIVLGSIGFILGLLLRRRFPIIQRGVLPLVIASAVLVVALGWRGWLVHKMWMDTELPPVSLKLADCTNSVVNIHLKIPAGHAYQLELKGPRIQFSTGGEWKSSYNFSGHLRISNNGSLLVDLPIGSDKAWLTGSGYVLTGAGMQNTNVPPLSKFIQSHKNYDFEISFKPPPPPGSSIWLYCTVSVKDQ